MGLDVVGRLRRLHGVKGEIRLESYTDPEEKIFSYQPWYVSNKTVRVLSYRKIHEGFLVMLSESFEHVSNLDVAVELPELQEGEVYWKDMLGCAVHDCEQRRLGEIEGFSQVAGQPLLIVKDAKKVFYVPFNPEVVRQVNLADRAVELFWHASHFDG